MNKKILFYLPYAAISLALLLPSVALLWLLQKNMFYERQAVQRQYREKAHDELQDVKRNVQLWRKQLDLIKAAPLQDLYAESQADALMIYAPDSPLKLNYPALPKIPLNSNNLETSLFSQARQLEQENFDYMRAAYYYSLENNHSDIHLAARARQAHIRCLLKKQNKAEALAMAEAFLKWPELIEALDQRGHAIILYIRLLYIDLLQDTSEKKLQTEAFANDLRRAMFYAAPLEQIVFIKKEILRRLPHCSFPLLNAEKLSLQYYRESELHKPGLQQSANGKMYFYRNFHGIIFLFKQESLQAIIEEFWQDMPALTEGKMSRTSGEADWQYISFSDNWFLALRYNNTLQLKQALQKRLKIYYYSGAVLIIAVFVLLIVVIRSYRRNQILSELKNEVLSNVAHELKTPLASTRLLLETLNLRGDRLSADKVKQYHQTMSRENERLSLLVENFLTFSSIERHKFKIKIAPLNCESFIEGINSAVKDRFSENYPRLTIINECKPASQFTADSSSLMHAVLNLIENAFKYSQKEVTFKVTAQKQQLCFTVIDRGIGLAAQQQKKIFKRFHQVDRSLSGGTYGCGLGLSIVDSIIRAHGSEVLVDSEKGKGSTFSFVLKR